MTRLLFNGSLALANGVALNLGDARLEDVADWDHSWDMRNATVSGSRVTRIENRSDQDWPLIADTGAFGALFAQPALSGPVYTAVDSRFGGRPSAHCDLLINNGGFFDIFSMLATCEDPYDDDALFEAGLGYDMPYVLAVLARPVSTSGGKSIWDSVREGAPTLTSGVADTTKWGVTTGLSAPNAHDTVADLWPTTTIARSDTQTVLAVGYFNAASSWFEVAQRPAAGAVVRTREALVLTDRNPSSNPLQAGFREGFVGFVSGSYFSAACIKFGAVDEAAVTALVDWASPYLVTP